MSGACATPKKIRPRQAKTPQTKRTIGLRRAISHLIGPYLTPGRAQCGVNRPTLSLRGPIHSLRRVPFPDIKGLIRESRGPRNGKGSKVYQKATREARYMPEGPTICRRWSTSGLRIAHSMTERARCRSEMVLRAHCLPNNSHLRPEEVQFGVEAPTLGQWGHLPCIYD